MRDGEVNLFEGVGDLFEDLDISMGMLNSVIARPDESDLMIRLARWLRDLAREMDRVSKNTPHLCEYEVSIKFMDLIREVRTTLERAGIDSDILDLSDHFHIPDCVLRMYRLANHLSGSAKTNASETSGVPPGRSSSDKPGPVSDAGGIFKDEVTEARDKLTYEESMKGTTYGSIVRMLKQHPEWDSVDSEQGVKDIARRYAERHGLKKVPRRHGGRKPKNPS